MLWSVMISFGVSAVISFVVFLSIFLVVVIQKSKNVKNRAPRPLDSDPAATDEMLQPRDPVHDEVDSRSQAHQPGPEDSLLPSAPPAEEVFNSYPAKTEELYPKLNDDGLEVEKGS